VTSPRGSLAKWCLDKGRLKKKVFGALVQYPALKRTAMFHATSKKEYNEIRAAGYRQPIAIVPIGMDVQTDISKSHEGLRRITFFGRLHAVKAVDRLLEAWRMVNMDSAITHARDWELVIAGPDCGVKDALESTVAELRIPRVKFVGELTGTAKYRFLAESDLYVLPSHSENFGITVAEALSCGTPSIVSTGTPWQGVVDHNAGWWIPNTPSSIAKVLGEAIMMPEDALRAKGRNGMEWISNDFGWDGVGKQMCEAYQWLLGNGDKPPCVHED